MSSTDRKNMNMRKWGTGMQNWKGRLREYGADVDGAMERLGDDEEFYHDCLVYLWQDEQYEFLQKHWARVQSGEVQLCTDEVFDAVHTLKGVTGNLGLNPLYMALSQLTEELRVKREAGARAYYPGFIQAWETAKAVFELDEGLYSC